MLSPFLHMIQLDPEKLKRKLRIKALAQVIVQVFVTALLFVAGHFLEISIEYVLTLACFWVALLVWVNLSVDIGEKAHEFRFIGPGEPLLDHLSDSLKKSTKIMVTATPFKKKWACSVASKKCVVVENAFLNELSPLESAKLVALTYHTRLTDEATFARSILANQLSISIDAFVLYMIVQWSKLGGFLYVFLVVAIRVVGFVYSRWNLAEMEAQTQEDVEAMSRVLDLIEKRQTKLPLIWPLTAWSKFRLYLARIYVRRAASFVEKRLRG